MATSTFRKNIILDKKAADKLADVLKSEPPKIKDLSKEFEESEKKFKQWLSDLKK